MSDQRWGSRLGVIMAVAGSAIGLGNFLRFPGLAAANGGGAFLVPYFISLILLGLPLMWIEWTIGRHGGGFGHSTAPGAFQTMWNKNRFIKYFGVIGIFGPVVIFIYYTYIESWLLGFGCFALAGTYEGCRDHDSMKAFLNSYRGLAPDPRYPGLGTAYLFFLLTFAANIWVVARGVEKGIEKVCTWALPVLFVLAIILMARVMCFGTPDPARPENNVAAGFGFLWNPDWSRLQEGKVWLAAAGQIFFTLSVGMGVVITYASYLRKKDDVVLSGLTSASANEVAEVILGGSIVIPAAFAFFGATLVSQHQGSVFDLGFLTMPLALMKAGFGQVLGFLWFALLFLAGVTSSISMAQPAIAFLEDEFDLRRREAVAIFGLVTFILCHVAIFGLGQGAVDELDFWGGTFCLVLFGLVEVVLFSWVFGMDRAWTEMHAGADLRVPAVFRFIITYVTPALLAAIIVAYLKQDGIPRLLMEGVPRENVPVIWLTRIVLVLLFSLLSLLVWIAWRRRPAAKEAA